MVIKKLYTVLTFSHALKFNDPAAHVLPRAFNSSITCVEQGLLQKRNRLRGKKSATQPFMPRLRTRQFVTDLWRNGVATQIGVCVCVKDTFTHWD